MKLKLAAFAALALAVLLSPGVASASPCKHSTTSTTVHVTTTTRKPCPPKSTTTTAPASPVNTSDHGTVPSASVSTAMTLERQPVSDVVVPTVSSSSETSKPEDDSLSRVSDVKLVAHQQPEALAVTGFSWKPWAVSALGLIAIGAICLALADFFARKGEVR